MRPVILAAFQAYGIAVGLEGAGNVALAHAFGLGFDKFEYLVLAGKGAARLAGFWGQWVCLPLN